MRVISCPSESRDPASMSFLNLASMIVFSCHFSGFIFLFEIVVSTDTNISSYIPAPITTSSTLLVGTAVSKTTPSNFLPK